MNVLIHDAYFPCLRCLSALLALRIDQLHPSLWLQVLVLQGARAPTHFGHHQRKLDMVQGTSKAIVSVESAKTYAGVRPLTRLWHGAYFNRVLRVQRRVYVMC